MSGKNMAYREMRAKQSDDLRNNLMNFHIYRLFSTPFTYIFVKLGVSPNAITIASSVLCLIGFYFLSRGTYSGILLGMAFFILFKTFDMSDGEVARIQNSTSREGMLFDRISHYVFSLCIGLGFGFGLYKLYQNDIYLMLGFVFSLVLVLENAMRDLIKLFLRESIIRSGSRKTPSMTIKQLDDEMWKKYMGKMYGRLWGQGNVFSRLAGIYPFQGIIFIDSIVIPIFLVLALIEFYLVEFVNIQAFFYGYNLGLISLYMLIIIISKSLWVVLYILRIEKKRSIAAALKTSK